MAANRRAVDHVRPVVGRAQIDQRLQQRIPTAPQRAAFNPDLGRLGSPFVNTT